MSLGTLSIIAVLDVETITMGPDIRHFPQDNPIPGVSDFPLKNQTGFKNIWFPVGQQIHIFLDWVIGSIVRDGCHLTAKNLNRTLKAKTPSGTHSHQPRRTSPKLQLILTPCQRVNFEHRET